MMKNNMCKPFLKWVGGKSQLLGNIRDRYPSGLGKTITRYVEPFIGGGAVLFDILNNYSMSSVYISDINNELIQTYAVIRDSVSELISILKTLETNYISRDDNDRNIFFYFIREEYNLLKQSCDDPVKLAAMFIFLNRTCFNGLYRVNSKGLFNVPHGKYNNPKICDSDNLFAVSEKLQGVTISQGNYKETRNVINSKTFVYIDPPYRPLTSTASFNSYNENGFGDEQQRELSVFIYEMSRRGAHIITSNSDPKNINKDDDFFDDLYSSHTIERVNASRKINSDSDKRGYVTELLIHGFHR